MSRRLVAHALQLQQGMADREQMAGEAVMPLAVEVKVQGLQVLLEDEVDEFRLVVANEPEAWSEGSRDSEETTRIVEAELP